MSKTKKRSTKRMNSIQVEEIGTRALSLGVTARLEVEAPSSPLEPTSRRSSMLESVSANIREIGAQSPSKKSIDDLLHEVTENSQDYQTTATMIRSADLSDTGTNRTSRIGLRLSNIRRRHSPSDIGSINRNSQSFIGSFSRPGDENFSNRLFAHRRQRRSSEDSEQRENTQEDLLAPVHINRPSAVMAPSNPSFSFGGPIKQRLAVSSILRTFQIPKLVETGVSIVEQPDGTFKDRHGVRFCPSVLTFRNIFEGERRVLPFVLQNVSTRPVKVSITGPSSMFFSLKNPGFNAVLAPGISHHDTLTLQPYPCHANGIMSSCLAVVVDGHTEIYGIETSFAAPKLEVQPPELDFGTVNLGAPVRVKVLSVRNLGALVCSFAVDVSAQALDIYVRPTRGKVHANKEVSLHCEFAPAVAGEFTRMIWVRGAGVALPVPVHVDVVRPKLELCYPPAHVLNCSPSFLGGMKPTDHRQQLPRMSEASVEENASFALVDFGPTYFGTKKRLFVTIRNVSADTSTFVVLIEKLGKVVKTLQEAYDINPDDKVFLVHPEEGRMESFETRIFTFGFDPQLWVSDESGRCATEKREFLVFLRVIRVLCMDIDRQIALINKRSICDPEQEESLTSEERVSLDESYAASETAELRRKEILSVRNSAVRLCLHGEALPAALAITPTALRLGCLRMGARETRVLRLTNQCPRLPLAFRVAHPPPPGVRVAPARGSLQPGGAVELTVHVQPVSFGLYRHKLTFELLGRSEPLLEPTEQVQLDVRKVTIFFTCLAEFPPSLPRFAQGLTPIINREVGVIGDGVPFCSTAPKPRMAMLRSDLRSRQMLSHAQRATSTLSSGVTKAPPTTPKISSCGSVCDQEDKVCCSSCYDRSEDWSTSESSTDDDDSGGGGQAGEREAAASAAAQVERLLVPNVPRIVCGVVMEPITESAEGAEASVPAGEAEEGSVDPVASAASAATAATAAASPGCVIGTFLDAVVQVHESSSSDRSPDTASADRGANSGEDANESQESRACVVGDADENRALQDNESSEELIRITECTQTTTPQTLFVHTNQSCKKQQTIFGNSSTINNESCFSSVMPMVMGDACISDDNRNLEIVLSQRSSEKQQDSISSNFTTQSHPIAPILESQQSHNSPTTSIMDVQTSQFSEKYGTTTSLNEITLRHTSTIREMTSEKAMERTDLSRNPKGLAVIPEKNIQNPLSAGTEHVKLSQTLNSRTLFGTTTHIPDNASVCSDTMQIERASAGPKQLVPNLSLNNRKAKHSYFAKEEKRLKNITSAKQYSKPMKNNVIVLANSSFKKPGKPKQSNLLSSTTITPERTARSDIFIKSGQSKVELSTYLAASNTKFSDPTDSFKEHLKTKKKHKKKNLKVTIGDQDDDENEHDEDDNKLGDIRRTVQFSGSMIPVSPTRSSTSQAKDRKEKAFDAIKKRKHCEALGWALGQQVHPHCAFIAFPNDAAQRSLRPWPSNRLTRNIFTGERRYAAPPDTDETLNPKQMLTLKEREELSRLDIRQFAERCRAFKASLLKEPLPKNEYDVEDSALYNYRRFHPGCEVEEKKCKWLELAQDPNNLQTLVPLTPTQLTKVRLTPPQVDYGTVGVGSHVSVSVTVHNGNSIPVKVNASSTIASLSIAGNGMVYVRPQDSSELDIVFQPNSLGRFNGTLRYSVNDSHVFETPVTAKVVLRSLNLPVQSLQFGFLRGAEEAFPQIVHIVTIQNPLQVACKFEWMAVNKTCYDIIPRQGEVPSLGARACELTYCANLDAQTSDASLLLASESDNYLELSCRLVATPYITGGFVHAEHTQPEISLLQMKRFYIYLYNASYMESLFRVEEYVHGGESLAGKCTMTSQNQTVNEERESSTKTFCGRVTWQVRPVQGSMRPRSLRRLHLWMRALAPGSVTFHLRVLVGAAVQAPLTSQGIPPNQRHRPPTPPTLFTTITTFVDYPNVTVQPSEMHILRVTAGSHIAKAFSLQNVGNVEASVELAEVGNFAADGEWAVSLSAESMEPLPKPLVLLPRSAPVQLYLLFRPADVASYEFLVPFVVNGGVGPPLWAQPKTWHADHFVPGGVDKNCLVLAPKLPFLYVEATVARRIVEMSGTEFNFNCNTGDPSSNVTRHVLKVSRIGIGTTPEQYDKNTSKQQGTTLNRNVLQRNVFGCCSKDHLTQKDEVFYLWTPLKFLNNTPFSIDIVAKTLNRGTPKRVLQYKATKGDIQSKLLCKMIPEKCSYDLSEIPDDLKFSTQSSTRYYFYDGLRNSEYNDDDILLCSELGPQDTSCWEITFQPRDNGTFSMTLPVYLSGFNTSKSPFVRLLLTGVNNGPSLTISSEEVFLPPRPLNIPFEATIKLKVCNFQKETNVTWACESMKCEIGSPVAKDCLQVMMTRPTVPAGPIGTVLIGTLIFKSSRPLGLRACIVFGAEGVPNVKCSLMVTAIADNSLFSTHSYLRARRLPFEVPAPLTSSGGTVPSSPSFGRGLPRSRQHFISTDEEYDKFSLDDYKLFASANGVFDTSTISSTNTIEGAPGAAAVTENAAVLTTEEVEARVEMKGEMTRNPKVGLRSSQEDFWKFECMSDESVWGEQSETNRVRRRRGSSRCRDSVASVDADTDSIGSSEDNESVVVSAPVFKRVVTAIEMNEEADDDLRDLPLYPDARDTSEEAHYIRRINQALEEWTYDVAFRREYWVSLPFGINECYLADRRTTPESEAKTESTDRQKKEKKSLPYSFGSHMPFIGLRNIAGSEAVDIVLGRGSETAASTEAFKYARASYVSGGGGESEKHSVQQRTSYKERASEPRLETYVPTDALSCVQRYATFLQLMRCNGAVMPHVHPEYLIDYARYELLFLPEAANKTKTEGVGDVPSEDECNYVWSPTHLRPKVSATIHRRLSHMAWINVGLQMVRTFWLPKIDEEHTYTMENSHMKEIETGLSSYQFNLASAAILSVEELYLLTWLNQHYERARKHLCPQSQETPPPRMIDNFDRDLADSLILAAVIIDICPFLMEYMPDLYPRVTTSEEAQHNAARLISALAAIRLGFTLSVRDVVQPLAVKMVLLVAFLYNVLPSLGSYDRFTISAPLSTRGGTSLTLVNPSGHRLFYLAKFIGDTGSFFSAMAPGVTRFTSSEGASSIFQVHPGQRLEINVNFHVRTFRKQSCTLMLSGNLYAPNFGRGVAFHLEGQPSSLEVSSTLHVTSSLYRPSTRKFTVTLPYALTPRWSRPLEFDLYLQDTEPEVGKAFQGLPWAQQQMTKVLRRLSLNQTRLRVVHQPPPAVANAPARKIRQTKEPTSKSSAKELTPVTAELDVTVCAFTPFTRNFWIGCVHPTFGDFIVKLVSHPTLGPPLAKLKLPLPQGWRTVKCMCNGRMTLVEGIAMLCPLMVTVMVPSRNNILWRAVITMFEKTLDEQELRFWRQNFDSPIGNRVIRWILRRNNDEVFKEYDYIFNSSTNYSVNIDSSYVYASSEMRISDTLSEESEPLIVHVSNNTPGNILTRMKLTSKDGRELRIYTLEAEMPPEGRQTSQDTIIAETTDGNHCEINTLN